MSSKNIQFMINMLFMSIVVVTNVVCNTDEDVTTGMKSAVSKNTIFCDQETLICNCIFQSQVRQRLLFLKSWHFLLELIAYLQLDTIKWSLILMQPHLTLWQALVL